MASWIGLAAAFGQECQFVDPPPSSQMLGGGSGTYASRNGWYLPTTGTLRILIILAEVQGAVDSPDWPAHSLPIWIDNLDPNINLFNHNVPSGTATGLITRYFQDASSGQFNVIADYLLAPSNGGIFQVANATKPATIAAVNASMSTINTGHGYTILGDFDKYTAFPAANTGPGQPKPNTPDGRYDHVMFIWRTDGTNNNTGSAYFGSPGGPILGYESNTWSQFFSHNGIPIDIMRHEFSHLLYGGNNFHTGGGGWSYGTEYFITLGNGWSNMSLYNGSLSTWNAWDRQRMGWKTPGSSFEITARNANNTAHVNGDLDATVPAQAGTYILRDFVQTGDAIRIKLPFTDPSTEYPEFLWVENHQGKDQNGNPFDKWQHENPGNSCVNGIVPGLQMYVQIDKEVREASSHGAIYDGPGDHIRPIDANGHYDEKFTTPDQNNYCVCWNCPVAPFQHISPNPFTGSADRHFVSHDNNNDGSLVLADFKANWMENVGGTYYDNLFYLGNARQVFTPGGNNKVGVGTNPSSATMMNLVGYDQTTTGGVKNLRRIYLNGVSVELMAQNTDGSIKVKVRFDDVDVKNDARWCADEIQLNPVVTSTGYSLNVTAGKTVTLDRGTTATRRNNPETYNGQQVFNSATLMRCPANTWLNLAPGGGFTVTNGSTLRLESGSRMDIGNGAVLRVKRGGKLELMGGSVLNVLPGGQVIIEEDWQPGNDGRLVFFPNARINLEASSSVLEFAGVLDIQPNATFIVSRSGNPSNTYGLVKFTSTKPISYNVTAGANTRFILQSTGGANRILHVQQESLYGPASLVEFKLASAKATLAPNARIVPPVAAAATISFINATVTSPTGVRNNHRGVRLNGQPLVYLNNSTFSKGAYGVYSYNTTLGNYIMASQCSFLDCNTGMYAYDKGIIATKCEFNNCNDGLIAVQMSQTSSLTDCGARYNQNMGVSFQGSATLKVANPAFDHNTIGLAVSAATAVVACGSVSYNGKRGFQLTDGATLRMDGAAGPHDPVTAIRNGATIWCQLANNAYLDQGYNSLRPQYTGTQSALCGTFLCQPYSATQPARKNNWNGTVGMPLTSLEYAITSCGGSIAFQDPASVAETPCGQVEHLVPGQEEAASLFTACPDCGTVETLDGASMPLNAAIMEAWGLAENDSLPNNDLLAVEAFHAILTAPADQPNEQENYLLNYGYNLMQESYGDAVHGSQLAPATDDAALDLHADMVVEVQDLRAQSADPGSQEDFIFYTAMQKAQTVRAAGRLGEAIGIIAATPEPPQDFEKAYKAQLLCYAQTELASVNGAMEWDEVEEAMEVCIGHGAPKRALAQATGHDMPMAVQPSLRPNPATTAVVVQGWPDTECTMQVMDLTGRMVAPELRFTGQANLPLDGINTGTYLCRLSDSQGRTWADKLVVGR